MLFSVKPQHESAIGIHISPSSFLVMIILSQMEPYPHFHSPPSMCVCAHCLCDPMDYTPLGSSVHRISRQEYWRGLPFLSPGDLPHPGIEPIYPALAGGFFTTEPPENTVILIQGRKLSMVIVMQYVQRGN